jgi:hypothetical protein
VTLLESGLAVAAAVVVLAIGTLEALAFDCRLLERRNYRPTPQQSTAQLDQEHPRKLACDVDLEKLRVGDYCVQHVQATDIVRARVFASGSQTIAIRALLSVRIAPFRISIDINSSYIGRKRYFGEARDDAGRELDARRVLHRFPQEDDEDVPPPCVNSAFVTVRVDPAILQSRRTEGYSIKITDDLGNTLNAMLSGKIIDAVLMTAALERRAGQRK